MYHLTDQLGSVRDVVDASTGSLVGSLDYSPYGQVQRKSGSVSPQIQFAQLPWDNNAGLSVSATRFYDAGFARWMSRDPIREAGGINLYGYGGGSPINLTDPTGNCPMCLAAPLTPEVVGGAVLLLGGAGLWIQQNVINPNVFPQSTPLVPPLFSPLKVCLRVFGPQMTEPKNGDREMVLVQKKGREGFIVLSRKTRARLMKNMA